MPKSAPPPPRKRFQFSLRTLLIAVVTYCGLWAATFEISIRQLASRCRIEPGRSTWMELPGGHVRVTHWEESGKELGEEGFTVFCPAPFYIRVTDDASPNCVLSFVWLFGWIIDLNSSDEMERCERYPSPRDR